MVNPYGDVAAGWIVAGKRQQPQRVPRIAEADRRGGRAHLRSSHQAHEEFAANGRLPMADC
jgi:hypothetical protein